MARMVMLGKEAKVNKNGAMAGRVAKVHGTQPVESPQGQALNGGVANPALPACNRDNWRLPRG